MKFVSSLESTKYLISALTQVHLQKLTSHVN